MSACSRQHTCYRAAQSGSHGLTSVLFDIRLSRDVLRSIHDAQPICFAWVPSGFISFTDGAIEFQICVQMPGISGQVVVDQRICLVDKDDNVCYTFTVSSSVPSGIQLDLMSVYVSSINIIQHSNCII
jgi:hypothetical protein